MWFIRTGNAKMSVNTLKTQCCFRRCCSHLLEEWLIEVYSKQSACTLKTLDLTFECFVDVYLSSTRKMEGLLKTGTPQTSSYPFVMSKWNYEINISYYLQDTELVTKATVKVFCVSCPYSVCVCCVFLDHSLSVYQECCSVLNTPVAHCLISSCVQLCYITNESL